MPKTKTIYRAAIDIDVRGTEHTKQVLGNIGAASLKTAKEMEHLDIPIKKLVAGIKAIDAAHRDEFITDEQAITYLQQYSKNLEIAAKVEGASVVQINAINSARSKAASMVSRIKGEITGLSFANQIAMATTQSVSTSLYAFGPAGVVAAQGLNATAAATTGLTAAMAALPLVAIAAGLIGIAKATQAGIPQLNKTELAIATLRANGITDLNAINDALAEVDNSLAGQQLSHAEQLAAIAAVVKANRGLVESTDIVSGAIALAVTEVDDATGQHVELTKTAIELSGALRVTGTEVGDVNEFLGRMVTAANLAQTGASKLITGIANVGNTATNAGFPINDLLSVLVQLDNQGWDPSQRGSRAFRSILSALVAPTKEAKGELKALGVQLVDSNGKATTTKQRFDDLKTALAGNEDAGRILGAMFDTLAAEGMAKLIAAEGNAATSTDTLNEALEKGKTNLADYTEAMLDARLQTAVDAKTAAFKNMAESIALFNKPLLIKFNQFMTGVFGGIETFVTHQSTLAYAQLMAGDWVGYLRTIGRNANNEKDAPSPAANVAKLTASLAGVKAEWKQLLSDYNALKAAGADTTSINYQLDLTYNKIKAVGKALAEAQQAATYGVGLTVPVLGTPPSGSPVVEPDKCSELSAATKAAIKDTIANAKTIAHVYELINKLGVEAEQRNLAYGNTLASQIEMRKTQVKLFEEGRKQIFALANADNEITITEQAKIDYATTLLGVRNKQLEVLKEQTKEAKKLKPFLGAKNDRNDSDPYGFSPNAHNATLTAIANRAKAQEAALAQEAKNAETIADIKSNLWDIATKQYEDMQAKQVAANDTATNNYIKNTEAQLAIDAKHQQRLESLNKAEQEFSYTLISNSGQRLSKQIADLKILRDAEVDVLGNKLIAWHEYDLEIRKLQKEQSDYVLGLITEGAKEIEIPLANITANVADAVKIPVANIRADVVKAFKIPVANIKADVADAIKIPTFTVNPLEQFKQQFEIIKYQYSTGKKSINDYINVLEQYKTTLRAGSLEEIRLQQFINGLYNTRHEINLKLIEDQQNLDRGHTDSSAPANVKAIHNEIIQRLILNGYVKDTNTEYGYSESRLQALLDVALSQAKVGNYILDLETDITDEYSGRLTVAESLAEIQKQALANIEKIRQARIKDEQEQGGNPYAATNNRDFLASLAAYKDYQFQRGRINRESYIKILRQRQALLKGHSGLQKLQWQQLEDQINEIQQNGVNEYAKLISSMQQMLNSLDVGSVSGAISSISGVTGFLSQNSSILGLSSAFTAALPVVGAVADFVGQIASGIESAIFSADKLAESFDKIAAKSKYAGAEIFKAVGKTKQVPVFFIFQKTVIDEQASKAAFNFVDGFTNALAQYSLSGGDDSAIRAFLLSYMREDLIRKAMQDPKFVAAVKLYWELYKKAMADGQISAAEQAQLDTQLDYLEGLLPKFGDSEANKIKVKMKGLSDSLASAMRSGLESAIGQKTFEGFQKKFEEGFQSAIAKAFLASALPIQEIKALAQEAIRRMYDDDGWTQADKDWYEKEYNKQFAKAQDIRDKLRQLNPRAYDLPIQPAPNQQRYQTTTDPYRDLTGGITTLLTGVTKSEMREVFEELKMYEAVTKFDSGVDKFVDAVEKDSQGRIQFINRLDGHWVNGVAQ